MDVCKIWCIFVKPFVNETFVPLPSLATNDRPCYLLHKAETPRWRFTWKKRTEIWNQEGSRQWRLLLKKFCNKNNKLTSVGSKAKCCATRLKNRCRYHSRHWWRSCRGRVIRLCSSWTCFKVYSTTCCYENGVHLSVTKMDCAKTVQDGHMACMEV